jgi:hypothetical protein
MFALDITQVFQQSGERRNLRSGLKGECFQVSNLLLETLQGQNVKLNNIYYSSKLIGEILKRFKIVGCAAKSVKLVELVRLHASHNDTLELGGISYNALYQSRSTKLPTSLSTSSSR